MISLVRIVVQWNLNYLNERSKGLLSNAEISTRPKMCEKRNKGNFGDCIFLNVSRMYLKKYEVISN